MATSPCSRCGATQNGTTSAAVMSVGEERALESTVVEEYSYVYNGSSLVRLDIKTTTTQNGTTTTTTSYQNFYYENSSTPMAVDWNGSLFYYTTNLQGDVTGLTASDGTSVVQYTYDAWGNILTVINTHTRAIISCGYYLIFAFRQIIIVFAPNFC